MDKEKASKWKFILATYHYELFIISYLNEKYFMAIIWYVCLFSIAKDGQDLTVVPHLNITGTLAMHPSVKL